jgi:uncharacterized SAM-binding protein YcdF (DUF218 family)
MIKLLLAALPLLILAVLSSSWLASSLAGGLLTQARELQRDRDCVGSFPVLVILGGGLEASGHSSAIAIERLELAVTLLRDLAPKVVVLSGGPTRRGTNITEAKAAEDFLRRKLGPEFSRHEFIQEGESVNTHDNAVFTAKLLRQRGLSEKVVVLTSVFHLPRAVASFQKAGLKVCAVGTPEPALENVSTISLANLTHTLWFLHEIVGRWIYHQVGWA